MHVFFCTFVHIEHCKLQYSIVNYKCIHAQMHIPMIKSPLQLTNNVKQDEEAPIDQPRRLSLRRPSFKREVVANESFIDIQLKPVTKDKATPQNAQQIESNLTKVTHNHADSLFVWLVHRLCRRFDCCKRNLSIFNSISIYLY